MNREKIAVRVIKEELSGFGFYKNGKEWFLGSDEDFEKSLRILLRQFLCPLLSPLTNISGLKKLYRNNVFSNSLVSREAREIISNLS